MVDRYEPPGSYEEALADGVVSEAGVEPDMGLFPAATERAFRFLCSHSIEQAIASTRSGSLNDAAPIHIVTVESGWPWIAAMQVNEQAKRCDSAAKEVLKNVTSYIDLSSGMEAVGIAEDDRGDFRRALTAKGVAPYIRLAIFDMLMNPPVEVFAPQKEGTRHSWLKKHLKSSIEDLDEVLVRKNEPESEVYRGSGGWDVLSRQSARRFKDELSDRLDVEQIDQAFELIAQLIARDLPARLRPFKVTVLDTRPTDELLAQADVIYGGHPEVKETELYSLAADLAKSHVHHDRPYDLSMLDDDDVTVLIASHWPLRHRRTGDIDDAGWAFMLNDLERKLQTNGISIFFPWNLPRPFDPEHKDMTLEGAHAMMVSQYPFEVTTASEPISDILKAIADIGIEAAAIAPQLQYGGRIGRLILRKRQTLAKVLGRN